MKNNENGRSMVEMLGVLAIIGVLSVTGFLGYSRALRRYRANEVIGVATKLYMIELSNSSVSAKGASYGVNGRDGLTKAGLEKPLGTVDMSSDENGNITVTNFDDYCEELCSVFTGTHAGFTITCGSVSCS